MDFNNISNDIKLQSNDQILKNMFRVKNDIERCNIDVKLNRCNLIPIYYTTRKMPIYSDDPKNR